MYHKPKTVEKDYRERRVAKPNDIPSDKALEAEIVDPPLDLVHKIERELEAELRNQLKRIGPSPEGGLDLTDVDYDDVQEADHTRLARLTYGMGYLRLLAFLSRRPPNIATEAQQAKLSLAYIQHVETNDRATLRLSARTVGEAQLDTDLVTLREEITRIAFLRTRREERLNAPEETHKPATSGGNS